jgi:hypothetical protein
LASQRQAAANATRVSAFRPAIVLFGDSITEFGTLEGGWQQLLEREYNRRVRGGGVGWDYLPPHAFTQGVRIAALSMKAAAHLLASRPTRAAVTSSVVTLDAARGLHKPCSPLRGCHSASSPSVATANAPYTHLRSIAGRVRVASCTKADIINRGFGGYNTRWGAFVIDELLASFGGRAKLVTVAFGANDAADPAKSA